MGRQSQYTKKRDDLLAAIRKLTAQQGGSPSLREISDETGISIATLHSYLDKLSAEGAIEWQKKAHRAITIKNSGTPSLISAPPLAAPQPAPTLPPAPTPAPARLEAIDPGF